MTDLSRARELLRTVTLYRRKGDAAARQGHHREAEQAWITGLEFSDEVFGTLSMTPELESVQVRALDEAVAVEGAELMGVRGGLFRRLDRTPDALASYRTGALLERIHHLPQTYNRANSIKFALIVGDKTLAQLHDQIVAFKEAIETRQSTDERFADDAWPWADLGDMRLLLGDEQGAALAYQTFVAKGKTDSPISTLAVLKEIVGALSMHGDPDASRMATRLNNVETMLTARLRR